MKPVELIIAGAGDRGSVYSSYAKIRPKKAKVVGVAEPRDFYRERMVEEHDIPEENTFTDWKDMAKKDKFADAVIIATQDHMHKAPTLAFAKKKYHILLEKPMAPDEKSCKDITKAVKSKKIIFAVGHVLRYTRYTQKLKSLLDSGFIGEVMNIQRLEPVGYWHQAHSFVRLTHFRHENKPETAGNNCMECEYEPECPYSAKRIYLNLFEKGKTGWPVSVITTDLTKGGIVRAVRNGPYGRCVYDCDNDVVDHQVVNMEFEGGKTASFTMTGFTKARQRETRIFGTEGEIYGNGTKIQLYHFVNGAQVIVDTSEDDPASRLCADRCVRCRSC
jgi:predicted dehydrogenase